MFWKKKLEAAVPVTEGTGGATGVKPLRKEEELPSGHKNESARAVKLPGPRPLSGMLGEYITATYKVDADIVKLFKYAVRKRPNTSRAFDCRIYDPAEAEASEVQVKDYTSLDSHTDLIMYDGWFDEESKRVELLERKKSNFDVPLLTEAEIRQKIEGLNEPGSSVFFYQNMGAGAGGPLGRGAAIIELNPNYGVKKNKKYIVYTTNVIGMEPTAKRNKLYDSDKAKEIASWIARAHHKRIY